jgi:hypothetical protein
MNMHWLSSYTLLLMPPDVVDLLAKPADQVPELVVIQNSDDLQHINSVCRVVVVPALGDGQQPAYTKTLVERANKVVSFPWVLKDREQARMGFAKLDAGILGGYRNYLDDKLVQLRRDLVQQMNYIGQVVRALEQSVGDENDHLEDELASAKHRVECTQTSIGTYGRELENVLEWEKASDPGSSVRS